MDEVAEKVEDKIRAFYKGGQQFAPTEDRCDFI